MTPANNQPPLTPRLLPPRLRRLAVTAEEIAHRRIRRRLLQFIVENHRRREALRGLNQAAPRPHA